MKVTIIDYGAGNVFSVASAFRRLGIEPLLTADEAEIRSSDRVIFPGVGHAAPAMEQLIQSGLDQVIPQLKQPVMGICLGMQLMCKNSEEGNTQGLNIFEDISVVKFDDTLKIPHMGWNTIECANGLLSGLDSDVYFVHSYYAPMSTYTSSTCNYSVPFSASLEKDNFLGCQFHPEKSGKAGEEILKRFLAEKK
jgi:glutamine amidotransferase